MIEKLTFTKVGDKVFADAWPEHIAVSQQFLNDADPRFVRWTKDGVEFHVDNGMAIYLINGTSEEYPEAFDCTLLGGGLR